MHPVTNLAQKSRVTASTEPTGEPEKKENLVDGKLGMDGYSKEFCFHNAVGPGLQGQ